jgi:hypothetical protein
MWHRYQSNAENASADILWQRQDTTKPFPADFWRRTKAFK